jgi:hypothetical protein
MKCFDFINSCELKLTECTILSEQMDCVIVILWIKN